MPLKNSNSIPCQLCGISLDERTSIRGKPYFVCESCGSQLFIRRQAGISRLAEYKKLASEYPEIRAPRKLLEIQRVISEINGINAEIAKVERSLDFFFPDSDQLRLKKALQSRLEASLRELERTAGAKG